MLTVTRAVYYCEFCKRHRLTKHSIESHEPKCIYNPQRAKCGWHRGVPPAPSSLASTLKESGDLAWLHDEVEGCPACMLAVVVQAYPTWESGRDDLGFDYKVAVDEYRSAEREDMNYAY